MKIKPTSKREFTLGCSIPLIFFFLTGFSGYIVLGKLDQLLLKQAKSFTNLENIHNLRLNLEKGNNIGHLSDNILKLKNNASGNKTKLKMISSISKQLTHGGRSLSSTISKKKLEKNIYNLQINERKEIERNTKSFSNAIFIIKKMLLFGTGFTLFTSTILLLFFINSWN